VFLKNYTSDVPVSETIHRIEKVLVRCGVAGITKEYGPQGEVAAVAFSIVLPDTPKFNVRLPADKDAALQALWLDYAAGDRLSQDGNSIWSNARKKKRKRDFVDQAERTAWKIVQDWIEVQMSMIQLKQADHVQVFLPYVWDGQQTYYQRLKSNGFRAMIPEKTT
jgi:hypothetical protein